ncbi:hypothetical protein LDL72_00005 [Lactobacillus delbrueckii subsp. lactis DSM 20072]|nr:hypothetical protein LDL72_00005 [Lactobacillus delbrueckii subsp. lactis DSM 20072]EGD27238.1 hypothetical protein HMPREF5505_1116 [Lactobacillus delbrueckii subsp. lactis DSM 20072]OOV10715.1 hypothetical protein LL072_10420 [Lactobacillus delbrueckii subsp. lactis DSM 20072]
MWITFLREAKGEPSFDQTYPQGVEKVFDRVWTVDKSAKKPVDCREKIFRGLLSVHRRGIRFRQSKEKIGQVCKKKLGFFRFPCYSR